MMSNKFSASKNSMSKQSNLPVPYPPSRLCLAKTLLLSESKKTLPLLHFNNSMPWISETQRCRTGSTSCNFSMDSKESSPRSTGSSSFPALIAPSSAVGAAATTASGSEISYANMFMYLASWFFFNSAKASAISKPLLFHCLIWSGWTQIWLPLRTQTCSGSLSMDLMYSAPLIEASSWLETRPLKANFVRIKLLNLAIVFITCNKGR